MSSITLKENEIRPDHLIDEQVRRFEADVARIIARKDEFVAAPCPACGQSKGALAFQKHGMNYEVCGACETLYINPRPTPEILEMYYSSSENYAYWNTHIFPSSEAARREKIFRPRAERVAAICRQHGVRTGTLLEVGAGFGTFCEELRDLKVFNELIAVEPTPGLADTCRSRRLQVIEQPIETVEFDAEAIDVVVSFEVIEHLFEPVKFVEQCARVLASGGIFIATCPNSKGFDVATLGAVSGTIDPEHLNYFHPESLSQLVSSCGFEVLNVQTPGRLDAELVRKKILAGEFKLEGQPFLEQILLKDWDRLGEPFQNFLSENRLSSHMWIVAQKRK